MTEYVRDRKVLLFWDLSPFSFLVKIVNNKNNDNNCNVDDDDNRYDGNHHYSKNKNGCPGTCKYRWLFWPCFSFPSRFSGASIIAIVVTEPRNCNNDFHEVANEPKNKYQSANKTNTAQEPNIHSIFQRQDLQVLTYRNPSTDSGFVVWPLAHQAYEAQGRICIN